MPLVCRENWCQELQGLSLRNIAVQVIDRKQGKEIYRDFGEMLFTHFGVSGPVILSASAHMRDLSPERYEIHIDLKPGLNFEQLDLRLQRDFQKFQNRDFSNSLQELLPKKTYSGSGEPVRNPWRKEMPSNFPPGKNEFWQAAEISAGDNFRISPY